MDVPEILPRCDAAIIHGGHGICMAVLTAGIPAVVLPGSEQEQERIFNGKRLETMGTARCVPGNIEWNKVHNDIEAVAQEPIYRTNAQRWQKHIQQWRGPKDAWEQLVRLVSDTTSSIQ
ncbi:hypothetical protein ccbrp13_13470 [Ktedonobacteria bacterium brp13]|nr:hypothetical protein ccbrp13_13470 [Ktedonobacteria bacterium brp13]